ncbi:DDE domain-containing protein [Piscirickettsia salmonis EM-90]|nr:DDE domain-containing protein [Piscirickettsia salmonis EM-90]
MGGFILRPLTQENNLSEAPYNFSQQCLENDHKAVKRKSRFRQWYQSLSTARPTIDIMEAMRMVQKGQLRYIKKQNICAQNQLIDKLFGLAA